VPFLGATLLRASKKGGKRQVRALSLAKLAKVAENGEANGRWMKTERQRDEIRR
jgi:hypothetical protein